jgi:hypothetical protein
MTSPFTIHRKRTHHRSRNVVMVAEDFEAFSEILTKEFPDARYYMNPTWRQKNYLYPKTGGPLRTLPPRVLIHHSLHRIWQAADRWTTDITMILDPQWQPNWKRTEYFDWHPYWTLNTPAKPFVCLNRLGRFYSSAGIVTAGVGDISVHCVPGDDAHLRFAGRFFRLFGKIASDRNLIRIKDGEIIETYIDKTAWTWVGHAARKWAEENSNRFLHSLRPVVSPTGT